MKKNPLLGIREFGQSVWLDYIRRKMIDSGELKRLIEEDGLRGITSNPSIFEKAIGGSEDYDDQIRALALKGKSTEEIYQILTVKDVQDAADFFRPLYDQSDGRHGFVSLEVNPHLARDVEGTLSEARRLWSALDRPNVFIKVPGTGEGLTCITTLISEGINVNVTLLFGLPRYREVAEAYLAGLEKRTENGKPLSRVASVASFFLSRIDVLVDPLLEKLMKEGGRKARNGGKNSRPGGRVQRQSRLSESIKRCLVENGSTDCPDRARGPSVFCGPVPVRKTRNIPIPNTSSPSSALRP